MNVAWFILDWPAFLLSQDSMLSNSGASQQECLGKLATWLVHDLLVRQSIATPQSPALSSTKHGAWLAPTSAIAECISSATECAFNLRQRDLRWLETVVTLIPRA